MKYSYEAMKAYLNTIGTNIYGENTRGYIHFCGTFDGESKCYEAEVVERMMEKAGVPNE